VDVRTRIAAIVAARRAVRLEIVRMPVVPAPAIVPLLIVQVVHARRPSINGRPATIATRRARSAPRVIAPRVTVLRAPVRIITTIVRVLTAVLTRIMVIALAAPILRVIARKATVPKVIVRKPRVRPGRAVASAVAAEPVAVVAAVALPDK